MIREIPESYNGKYVCSNIRKEAYIRNMDARMEIYFVPAYERCVKERNAGYKINDKEKTATEIKSCYQMVKEKFKDIIDE